MKPLATLIAAAAIFAAAALPALAAPAPGSLVKLPNDGNPATQEDTAVYYVGADAKRYAFPNAATYATWYADFQRVTVISAAEMAALPLGGSVLVRPGTRLVKIATDPKVYAVEPSGVLRAIASEAVAAALYGADWNRRIDDLSDAFFASYTLGSPLATATYPTGTVLRLADGSLYMIDGATKRPIGSDALRASLGIREEYIIAATDLSGYAVGAAIEDAEPGIVDAAQRAVRPEQPPTFVAMTPPSNAIPIGADATLMTFDVSSGADVSVRQLVFRVDAAKDEPIDNDLEDIDDDKSGLIYGNELLPNLRDLRVVDDAGRVVSGAVSPVLDEEQDQSQMFTFPVNLRVAAGSTVRLRLRADTYASIPVEERYRASLVHDGTRVVHDATGADVAFLPAGDLAAAEVSTRVDSFELRASAVPGIATFMRGAKDAPLAGFTLSAVGSRAYVMDRISFLAYVDEGAGSGFGQGVDADNGSPTRANEMVSRVSLYDERGARIGGPVDMAADGRVTFTGLRVPVDYDATVRFELRGDINSAVELEAEPNYLAFDVTDASREIGVTDTLGQPASATGIAPNGGSAARYYAVIKEHGGLDVAWSGVDGLVVLGREAPGGTLTLKATDESYEVTTVSFRRTSGSTVPHTLALSYTDAAGAVQRRTAEYLGDYATFNGLAIPAPKGGTGRAEVAVITLPRSAGGLTATSFSFELAEDGPFLFRSKDTGIGYDDGDIASEAEFIVSRNERAERTTRYTDLALTALGPQGTLYRETGQEVLRFAVQAGAEGPARIRRLTFRLTPGDHGYQQRVGVDTILAADNDLLEWMADVNGDFQDDDGVVDLVLVGAESSPIGEGANGSISYRLDGHADSQGRNSASTSTGLIIYEFGEGGGITVPAGTRQEYSVRISTYEMELSENRSLTMELLAGAEFLWTDVVSGTAPYYEGDTTNGLPLGSSLTITAGN